MLRELALWGETLARAGVENRAVCVALYLRAHVDITAQQTATAQIHGLFGKKLPEPPLRRVAVAAPVPYQVKHDFRQRQRWRKQRQAMARLRLQRHALEDGGGHAGARDNRWHGE